MNIHTIMSQTVDNTPSYIFTEVDFLVEETCSCWFTGGKSQRCSQELPYWAVCSSQAGKPLTFNVFYAPLWIKTSLSFVNRCVLFLFTVRHPLSWNQGCPCLIQKYLLKNFILFLLPVVQAEEFYVCIYASREGDYVLFHHEGGVDVGDVDAKAQKLLIGVDKKISEEQVTKELLSKAPTDKRAWVGLKLRCIFSFAAFSL